MKYLAVLMVIGGAIFAGTKLMSGALADPGKLLAVAFGMPKDGQIEMHTVIVNGTQIQDPPRVNPRGIVLWQEWAEEHFAMTDPEGNPVTLTFRSATDLVPKTERRGLIHGVVIAMLEQGADYTMEYTPIAGEPTRYRYTFEAPKEDEFARWMFKPAELDR